MIVEQHFQESSMWFIDLRIARIPPPITSTVLDNLRAAGVPHRRHPRDLKDDLQASGFGSLRVSRYCFEPPSNA
jgi:hypothetical protein